jgi:hypothetical protein
MLVMIAKLGRDERNNNECNAARLGKIIQHVYRFCAFFQTAEIAFEIAQEYQQIHQCFPPNDAIHTDFLNNISMIFHSKYPDQFQSDSSSPFRISKNIALRAIDVISGNMHQFSLLVNTRNAPQISLVHRQSVVVLSEQQPVASDNQDTAETKKELKRK